MKRIISIILCIILMSGFVAFAETKYEDTRAYLLKTIDGEEIRLYSGDSITLKPGLKFRFGIEDNLEKKVYAMECYSKSSDGETTKIGAIGYYSPMLNQEMGGINDADKRSTLVAAPKEVGSYIFTVTIKYQDNSEKNFDFNVIIDNQVMEIELYGIDIMPGIIDESAYSIKYLIDLKHSGKNFEWNKELFDEVKVFNSNQENCLVENSFSQNTFEIFKDKGEQKFTLFLPEGILTSMNSDETVHYTNKDLKIDFEVPEMKHIETSFIDKTEPVNRGTYYMEKSDELIEYKIYLKEGFTINDRTKIRSGGKVCDFILEKSGEQVVIVIPFKTNAGLSCSISIDEKFVVNEKNEFNGRASLMFFTELRENVNLPDNAIFTDVSRELWAYEAISVLCTKNIIAGYEDGTFRPHNNITRAELAKLLCVALDSKKGTSAFSDVKEHWAEDYISKIGEYIPSDNSMFQPDKYATRLDVTVALMEMLGDKGKKQDKVIDYELSDLQEIDVEYAKKIQMAAENGIVYGYEDGTFKPNNNITRAEAATLIYRVMQ